MSAPRHPPAALAALLDALEADILGATVEEVGTALAQTGRARGAACGEVRSLLDEAARDSDGQLGLPAMPGAWTPTGLSRH